MAADNKRSENQCPSFSALVKLVHVAWKLPTVKMLEDETRLLIALRD